MKTTILSLCLLLLAGAAPASAQNTGAGIGISIGGNRGTAFHVFLGQGRDPGWGYGWGISSPYGLNGSPTWGGAGYGTAPPRPYPQPIPEEQIINLPAPVYEWVADPETGMPCLKRTGWRKEPVPIKGYSYP